MTDLRSLCPSVYIMLLTILPSYPFEPTHTPSTRPFWLEIPVNLLGSEKCKRWCRSTNKGRVGQRMDWSYKQEVLVIIFISIL